MDTCAPPLVVPASKCYVDENHSRVSQQTRHSAKYSVRLRRPCSLSPHAIGCHLDGGKTTSIFYCDEISDKDYTCLLYSLLLKFLVCSQMQFLFVHFDGYFFFCFPVLLEILLIIQFTMKRRSDDPIGGAAPLPNAQLPTHGDMAREWRHTRLQMENANPGTIVANREVAKKVALRNSLTH